MSHGHRLSWTGLDSKFECGRDRVLGKTDSWCQCLSSCDLRFHRIFNLDFSDLCRCTASKRIRGFNAEVECVAEAWMDEQSCTRCCVRECFLCLLTLSRQTLRFSCVATGRELFVSRLTLKKTPRFVFLVVLGPVLRVPMDRRTRRGTVLVPRVCK